MAHFTETSPELFEKDLQQHLGYSDEEMERFKRDPKNLKMARFMASPKVRNSTLVFEVVKSHGCAEGMKVGDKLYFTGCSLLDPKRSSPWCACALSYVMVKTEVCHSLFLHGVDPNEMSATHHPCADCGSEYGWGQIIIKSYVIDESRK